MKRFLPILFVLILSSCVKPAYTPTAPAPAKPPQVVVLETDRALADATNVAAKVLKTLWDAGKLDPSTADEAKAYLSAVAKISDDIATVAQSSDDWPMQRAKLVALIARAGDLPAARSHPDLAAQISAVANLLNHILQVAAK